MKIMQTRFGRWKPTACAALGVAILFLAASAARGQGAEGVSVPLYAGNAVPLKDEFGRLMRGSPAAKTPPSRRPSPTSPRGSRRASGDACVGGTGRKGRWPPALSPQAETLPMPYWQRLWTMSRFWARRAEDMRV